MAARRNKGLADDQVAQLREKVAAGGRPRVRVSGVQFPAGTTGTVIGVGEPGVDGAEFVAVRVKVSGVIDELRFAPGELSMAGRGVPATALAERPISSAKVVRPRGRPRKSPAAGSAQAELPGADEASSATAPAASSVAGAAREAPPDAAAAKTAPRPARRTGSVPVVTVTLASAGTSWTVTAHRGARVIVKNAAVTPGVVAAVAALLDERLVAEAVAAVNDTARSEAEARAVQLRAELADVEAVLVSHRRP